MSAVCQRRKKSACAVSGTTWTGAEKIEFLGDARVRVEAGDLFVGVFLQCGPSGRGTGAKEGNSDCSKWVDRARRPTRLRARDRGVKDSEEQSGFGRGRKKRKRRKIRDGMAQVTWAGGAGVGWKYWGRPGKWTCLPAMRRTWQGLGQAGLLEAMRDVATQHDVHVGARGSTRRRTKSCLLGRTRETGTWKLSHD